MDEEGDRDAWLVVARLGGVDCRIVRSKDPGAQCIGWTAQADRGCARLLCAGAAVEPTGKHAARRPDSVRLAIGDRNARVLRACESQLSPEGHCRLRLLVPARCLALRRWSN